MVSAVFLMLVLLIGIPTTVGDFSAFGDKDDDKKENKNLKVSAEDSKAYQKQKEKAEKAKQKAEERKEKLKEKYEKEIKRLEEKAKKQEEKESKKYERELKKLEEKAKRLDDYNGKDNIKEFGEGVYIDYSSKTMAVCHIPKGNPDNFHTIVVGTPAVRAHLAHGDTLGECGDGEIVLEEYELKKAAKLAKLEEKRSELQQKFIDKAQKLKEKFEEKQNKRAEKLLEKVQSGEYYDEFIEDEGTLRQFELTFDSLTAEPIGQPSEPTEFSGSITLVTSSSTNSKGTMKFKVTECELGDESDTSYTCEYGKARTTSKGTGGDKNGLVIIASLHDDIRGSVPGIKAFVTADLESLEQSALRQLEGGTYENILTMHSPQSKITHQWFLGSEENGGTLIVTEISPSITSITDYEEADYDEVTNDDEDVEDEIEIHGEVLSVSVSDNSLSVNTDDGIIEVSVNDETEFDEGFDSLSESMVGLEVEIDALEIDGKLVATEIEIDDDLDDDDLDDDEDDEEDEEDEDDEDDDDDDEEDDD